MSEAHEARSARPLEAHAAMAMAAILREGIKYIKAGNESISVSDDY